MCVPVLAAAAIAGTVLSATSAVAGGIAANQAGKANAAAAKREGILQNNQVVRQQAEITKERRAIGGAQRVAAAASGRKFSGSVLDVAQGGEENAELDILSSVYGGVLASDTARFNARAARAEGKAGLIKGFVGAGTTLLTGGVKAAKMF